MKNLKNNRWFAGIAMIVLLLGVFFAVKAVENKEEKKPAPDTSSIVASTWHFTGTNVNEATNPEAWSDNPQDAQNCDGIKELPCSVDLNEPIEDYLENKTSEQIMDDPSVSKRSQ